MKMGIATAIFQAWRKYVEHETNSLEGRVKGELREIELNTRLGILKSSLPLDLHLWGVNLIV